MNVAARLVALALGGVFGVAAVAKLRDRVGTERSFSALGLRWPAHLAVVVPAIEALTAVALVVVPVAGAAVALGLLGVFSVVLLRVLRSGVPLGCACFGAIGARRDRPVGWGSLLRNLGLALLAVLVLLAAP